MENSETQDWLDFSISYKYFDRKTYNEYLKKIRRNR